MEFSGRLTAFPPSDLLQWARNDGRTGALIVRRSTREKRVLFEEGQIVSCLSDDPGEFYGQHLLLGGHIAEGDLIRALTHCARTGQRLGQALVELRIILPKTIQETLRDHIQDLVLDLFLWERGVFYFEVGPPPLEEILPSPIDNLRLALEGARWLDEYHRIRRVFVHDDIVLTRGQAQRMPPLSTRQRWILDKVNGRRTLAQLHRSIGGSYFRFLTATLDLCVNEVLDIADIPEDAHPGTHEVSLYRLMLEEAIEEEAGAKTPGDQGRREVMTQKGVPLTILQRLVPVWFGEQLPDSAGGSFYARCDGTARLGEILSPGEEDRSRELDLLFVALRRGVLALLPAPVAELEAAAAHTSSAEGERWWLRLLAPNP